jgi:hypothetical protein
MTRSNGRRGTSEEGEDGKSAGKNCRREGFERGDDGDGWRGSRRNDGMDRDVGCGAESAVGVALVAVGVSVRDLYGAENDDQKNAEKG